MQDQAPNFSLSSFSPDGVQVVWDSTSITLAATCLRKYQYKMIEGWRHRGLSVHLRFGQHYATALEHFHKLEAAGVGREEALRKVVREALENTWDYDYGLVEGGVVEEVVGEDGVKRAVFPPLEPPKPIGGKPWASGDNAKTRENLIRTIIWYFDTFADDPMETLIRADGQPAVEFSFSLAVDNGITFAGHIDRLVRYSGDIYVQDQKTTGSPVTPYYFRKYSPDIQMSMYTFAGKMIYAVPVKGVVVDAVQVAVGFSNFQRGLVPRTEGDLEEWYDETLFAITRAQDATRMGFFPKNPTACGNFGGCEFREVCARDPRVRLPFLKADFVQGERWDPLKRR
jgi:hypothetical protein